MSQVSLGNQTESLIGLRHLVVTFARQTGGVQGVIRAVDDVSLDVDEKEFVSLVGESGSGKTTLARAILRFNAPSSGSIFYKSADVESLRGKAVKAYRKNVQIVFQDPYECLNPRHDVFTIVSTPMRFLLGMKNNREMEDKVSALLKELGMNPAESMHKLPHQLSGGERQRVNIARALASDPEILIADEPMTMLDAAQRLNVLTLLAQLRVKRNLAVLMITHDLASAHVVSDRVMVMFRGRIVESGPTAEVLSRPYHPYVRAIMAATPALHRAVPSVVEQEIPVLSRDMSRGCNYRERCKYATQVCAVEEPPLEAKSRLHFAACHNSSAVIEESPQA